MRLDTHKANSLAAYGVEAEDIHEWIDGFFDHSRFHYFIKTGIRVDGFDPYDHRVHRHCMEAENECVVVFRERYPEDIIRKVFEQHIRDDYDGHYPNRDDFDEPSFLEKYHNK
jgi:hypothetical protein